MRLINHFYVPQSILLVSLVLLCEEFRKSTLSIGKRLLAIDN